MVHENDPSAQSFRYGAWQCGNEPGGDFSIFEQLDKTGKVVGYVPINNLIELPDTPKGKATLAAWTIAKDAIVIHTQLGRLIGSFSGRPCLEDRKGAEFLPELARIGTPTQFNPNMTTMLTYNHGIAIEKAAELWVARQQKLTNGG